MDASDEEVIALFERYEADYAQLESLGATLRNIVRARVGVALSQHQFEASARLKNTWSPRVSDGFIRFLQGVCLQVYSGDPARIRDFLVADIESSLSFLAGSVVSVVIHADSWMNIKAGEREAFESQILIFLRVSRKNATEFINRKVE